MKVTVIYSPAARQTREWLLDIEPSSTLAQALQNSGLYRAFPDLLPEQLDFGVWGKRALLGQALQENDRIEVYRPLLVDPKTARQERFRRQGAKSAGLFSTRRPGAKAGY